MARSQLRLHLEWTNVHKKCPKWSVWARFLKLKFWVKQCYQTNIGGKCPNWKFQMGHFEWLCSKSNRNFLWSEILDYRVLRSLLIFCFGHPTFQLISAIIRAMEHFFAVAGNVSRICRLCISPLEVLGGEPKKGALNFHELLAIKSCYRKEVWTPTTRVRHNRAGALRRRSESARPGWLYKP